MFAHGLLSKVTGAPVPRVLAAVNDGLEQQRYRWLHKLARAAARIFRNSVQRSAYAVMLIFRIRIDSVSIPGLRWAAYHVESHIASI
jgi:hypothetical protein